MSAENEVEDTEIEKVNFLLIELTETLKLAYQELNWLDKNALIKSRAGGDYIEVEHVDFILSVIRKVDGKY